MRQKRENNPHTKNFHIAVSYYCKRDYFRWGKISRICLKDISLGDNFHDCTPISFIKAYWHPTRSRQGPILAIIVFT